MTTRTKRSRVGTAAALAFLTVAGVLALATPASAEPIGPAQNIACPTITETTIKATWDKPVTGDQLNFLQGFAVSFNGPAEPVFPSPIDPDEVVVNVTAVPGQVSYEATATGLKPGTPYVVTVRSNVTGAFSLAVKPGTCNTLAVVVPPVTITCYAPFNSWDALIKQHYRDFLMREPRLDELVFWRQKLVNSPELPVYNMGPNYELKNPNGTLSGLFLTGVRDTIGLPGETNLASGYGLFRANNGAPNNLTNPYVPATAAGAPDLEARYPKLALPGAANRVYINESGQTRVVGTNALVAFNPTKVGCSARVRADFIVYLYEEARQTYGPAVRLYNAFFPSRALNDRKGIEFWRNKLMKNTWSLTRIADYFTTSQEFKDTYEKQPDGTYRPVDDAEFVAMIYVNVMKRPADGAGVAFWTRQLSEGKRTRGGVMVGFSESQEYRRLTSHEVQATVLVNSLTRSYKDPATPTTASEEDITKSKQVARLGLDSVTIAAVPTRVAMWLDARSYLPVEEPTPVLTSGDNANRWPANNESFAYTFTVVTTSAAYLAGITK